MQEINIKYYHDEITALSHTIDIIGLDNIKIDMTEENIVPTEVYFILSSTSPNHILYIDIITSDSKLEVEYNSEDKKSRLSYMGNDNSIIVDFDGSYNDMDAVEFGQLVYVKNILELIVKKMK